MKIIQNIPKTACYLLFFVVSLLPLHGLIGQHVQVTEDITSGTVAYGVKDTLTATNTVESGAELVLKAGERVFLKDYFHAKAGSRLSASIYTFFATDNISDMYVDLYWSIETQCLWDGLYASPLQPSELHGELVYVEVTNGSGQEIYHEILTEEDLNSSSRLFGRIYSYSASDSLTDTFQMNLYAIGVGTPLCGGSYQEVGVTLPYRGFDYVTADDATSPGLVNLSWASKSDLPTHYRIYRDGELLSIIDGEETSYIDRYSADDPNSLVNGTTYNYCVEAFNERLERAYPQGCDTGSTIMLNFEASDFTSANEVTLSWNNVSNYSDEVTITRDGKPLATLSAQAIAYTDKQPIYGKAHMYGIELRNNAKLRGAAFDEGQVAANGFIAGRVTTQTGDYALAGASLQAITTIEGISDTLNTVSDHSGYFAFSDVYYHEAATYTLSITHAGYTYVQNQQNIALSRPAPGITNLSFDGLHLFEVIEDENFIFDNLTVQSEPASDLVNLSWNYQKPSSNDTVYFRVYRNGERIAFLDDSQGTVMSFQDLLGVPGMDYTYEVRAYIKVNSLEVYEQTQTGNGTFPSMSTPELTATANNTNGVVDLSWSHSSTNFDSYLLFRDDALLTEFIPETTSYTDLAGIPGESHNYQLIVRTDRSGQTHLSDTITDNVIYPELKNVTLAAHDFTSLADGNLQIMFSPAHVDSYNFDGYRLYRDDELLQTIYKTFPRTYIDRTGLADQTYTYKVVAFLENGHDITEGGFIPHQENYPDVLAPTNLTASQHSKEGQVYLTWDYAGSNHDGFVLYREQDSITTIAPSARDHTNALNFSYANNTNFNYTLKAYTNRQGVISLSGAVNATGGPGTATGGATPVMPVNFTASEDLHNQVRLQWEYPNYVLARFIIYRDGVELATLDTDQRLYYDYTAAQGASYTYSLIADFEDPQELDIHYQSQQVFATGKVTSLHSISGLVTSQTTGFGLAGISLTASVDSQIGHATTDFSGFYRFTHMPEGTVTIQVDSPHSGSTVNNGAATVAIQPGGTPTEYTANFVSNLAYEKPISEIALPIVAPVTNALNTTVEVRWTTKSSNYSGFKVYRGLVELADVKAGDPHVVIDSLGYPGQDYSYRVMSYWTNELEEYQESEYVGVNTTFPIVAPVEALAVTPFAARDYLEITWSHPYDQYSYYEVLRNDELIGIVPSFAPLTLQDSISLPGQYYNYVVTAIEVRDGRELRSEPVTLLAQFPSVAIPTNITASVPAYQNHVALSWEYASQLFNGFRMFRDDLLIADIVINAPYPQNGTYHYEDYSGVPGTNHTYEVVGYVLKDDIRYESAPDQITQIYPALAPVTGITATPNTNKGLVNISWDYTAFAQDGYILLKDGQEWLTISDPSTKNHPDTDGVPGQSHTYSIMAYADRGALLTRYMSATQIVQQNFPEVPAPTSLSASDGDHPNAISIQWSYSSDINEGFILYRNDVELDTLHSGTRNYTELFNVQANHIYKARAFRNVNNTTYYSSYSNIDAGANNYDNFGNNFVAVANDVSASDGEFANSVRVTWSYADDSSLDRFDIYRDNELIDNVTPGNRLYNDVTATPAHQHMYQVVAIHEQNGASHSQSDTGHRQGNGSIRGSVVTYQEGTGVSGISITASAWIAGNRYDYSSQTNQDGLFQIDEVYYGPESADYEVIAFYSGHDFIDDTLETSLSLQENIGYVAPFRDRTAFILTGKVAYEGSSCALDTVKVTLQTRTEDGTQDGLVTSNEVHTNANGIYSFTVNPHDPYLLDYTLVVDTLRIGKLDGLPDTTWHNFTPASRVFQPQNLSQITTYNVEDVTTYPVELIVTNTCGPIAINQFDIRVSSMDGCFEREYSTLDNGRITVDLPPLAYTLQVTGIANPSPSTIPIVDYLRVRPATLDLYALHNDELKGNQDALEDPLKVAFIYHQQSEIAITSGFDTFLCDDPAMPAVLQQDENYTLKVEVNEQHQGINCSVTEGYLLIKNEAGESASAQRLDYDELGGFPPYTFTAGEPNIIVPFILVLIVEYHTDRDGFLGERIQRVIVEGQKTPPGNDVIVEVNRSPGGEVQLPLFVLRDPPGDGSYSYVEAGNSFEKTLKVNDMNSGSGGVKGKFNFDAFGVGLTWETQAKAGGGSGESASFSVKYESTERYQTSESSELNLDYAIGEDADVIVGAGMAVAYGINQRIAVGDGCTVVKSTSFAMAPNNIKTKWVYTVAQAKRLIGEYEAQLQGLVGGTFSIEGMNTQQAEEYISVLKENWKAILGYHRQETVPHFNVCDIDNLPNTFKDALEGTPIYRNFCDQVRIEDADSGPELNPEFKWTETLMEDYNTLSVFRKKLDDYINYKYVAGDLGEGSDQTRITNDLLNDVEQNLQDEYEQLYGPDVENITFSAGSTRSKEITVGKSSSRGYVQKIFFDWENSLGTSFGNDIKLVTTYGIGVQVGTQTKIVESESEIGAVFNYNFEFNKEKENNEGESATVGYVLSDDDGGDQFSVTVVRGVDPSHTPYFDLLGGRSSCPAEPGTIFRDAPVLSLEDRDGNLFNNVQYDVDPEEGAIFPIKIANANPFGETQLYEIYSNSGSNQGAADILFNNSGDPEGVELLYVPSDEPVFSYIQVFPGPSGYDYKDIQIAVRPPCERTFNTVADTLFLEVYFKRPCSRVSLLDDGNRTVSGGGTADGNHWVINKAPENEREKLFLKLVDYDPLNETLESIKLEYRRKATNHWTNIITLESDSLQRYYEAFKHLYPDPTYAYIWDITDLPLIDGAYEIRAMTSCGTSGENFSNILNGVIDRTSLQVFGMPEPADGFLSLGDEVSVTFNELIDCALFDPGTVTLMNITDNNAVPFTVGCKNDQLEFVIDHTLLTTLEGKVLEVTVTDALDMYGNAIENPVSWRFTVQHNPVYWHPDSLSIQVLQETTAILKSRLHNTTDAELAFDLSGHNLSWLSTSATQGSIPPSGTELEFVIDASTLSVGHYEVNIQAAIEGFASENLTLSVEVLPQGPEWTIDHKLYKDNMAMVANFNLDNVGLSSDTLDMISVWIDNSLRGVSNIRKVTSNNFVAYLAIAGNNVDTGHTLSFQIWDASTRTEYTGHAEQIYTYSKDAYYGTTANPVVLSVDSNIDSARYVSLEAGWNWLSFNTRQANMSVNQMLKSLNASDGDQIKNQNQTSIYSIQDGWESIDGLDSLDTRDGYLLHLAKADTLRLTGNDATITNIALLGGWNLIGYQAQEAQSLNDALTNLGAVSGDRLKSKVGFAEYSSSTASWLGMEAMEPNKAYMLYATAPNALLYNNGRTASAQGMVKEVGDWYVNPAEFEYNLTITGTVAFTEGSTPGDVVIGAFVGEECRGIGELHYYQVTGQYLVSLFVYANKEGEKITFKVMDQSASESYEAANTLTFSSNQHQGKIDDPYLFQNDLFVSEGQLTASPNPFVVQTQVGYTVVTDDTPVTIRLYDVNGMLVKELMKDKHHMAGRYQTLLKANDLSKSGIYVCKLQIGENFYSVKIAVQR